MKKNIAWVIALCLIIGMLGIGEGQEPKDVYAAETTTIGDLSGDGFVDVEDLDLCRAYITDASGVDSSVLALADVNNDDTEGSAKDLVRYKRYLAEPNTDWYTDENATEYHITNEFELYGLQEILQSQKDNFSGKTVYVDNDIVVNYGKEKNWDTSKELLKPWESIGSDSMSFAGIFDGQNHTISGIYQAQVGTATGLFAYTSKSSCIKNLCLKNSYFKTSTDEPEQTASGSIVGNAKGTISNVYSDATVEVAEVEKVVEETIDPIKFTAATTTAKGYTMSDTENGLQITGKAWVYATHTLETPVRGADIETITIRFKVTGGESALMKFYSGSEFFYVNLCDSNNPVVSKTTDAAGFTIVTLDFQTFQVDGNDTWTPDERATKKLEAIWLGCNNATGAPTFDYVAFNVKEESEETTNIEPIEFTAATTTAGGYTMSDTANGLKITGKAWAYATHALATPISGADIKTVTIRFKVTGGESALMKFFSDGEFFYVDLTGTSKKPENYVSRTIDEDGFTILTLDFRAFQMDAGDTWTSDERATKNLTSIQLGCNNATGAPTFDYVAFNVTKTKTVEIAKADFTTQNTTGGTATKTDTEDGLKISGAAWQRAVYTFPEAISGATIETMVIRFKPATGGASAIMEIMSDSNMIYINLNSVSGEGVVSRVVDGEFEILTLDFKKIAPNAGSNPAWEIADRSTKNLTSIKICINNASQSAVFDYVILTGETLDTDNLIKCSGYGGIVGYADDVNINQCWFDGSVKANLGNLGGIAGCMKGDSSITDTMMTGDVTSTKNVSQEKFVGGIVGVTKKADVQSITDCMMLGTVNVSWKDSEGASITGARATGAVVGRNTTVLNFSDVYTTNEVINKKTGGTINITNANVPGCGDLSANGTVSGAPMQRSMANITQNIDNILSDLGSDAWEETSMHAPILSCFADETDLTEIDPSYLQARSGGGIYLSNFDNAVVLEHAEEVGINPWDNYVGDENATVTHGTLNNGHGNFTGLNVITTTGYSGVKYNLPEAFALGQAKTLGVRFTASGWHNGSVASFVYLTSGDTKINITDYCNIYNGKDTSGTPTSISAGQLNGVNYLTICLTVDVETLLTKTDLTSIDGIILGHNSTSKAHVLDEFYYMPKYETISFNTTNTTGGTATKTDTDNGLELSKVAWQRATHTLSNPISGADIDTMTIRFKPAAGGAAAIMEVMSGSNMIYINLNTIKDDSVVSRVKDGDFEVLTLNFKKIEPNAGSNPAWDIADRSTKNLTSIKICINNASQTAVFDYVEFASAGTTEEEGLPVYEKFDNPDEEGLELAIFGAPTINTVDAFQTVKDSGARTVYFNLWGSYALDNTHLTTALTNCETVGLDAYIMVNNGHETETVDLVSFTDSASIDYTRHSAFKGLYAFDEPNTSQMSWMKSDMDKWESSKYKDYIYLANLMRCDSNVTWSRANTQTYLNSYWDTFLKYNDDNILMYDSYPLYANRKKSQVADSADVEGAEWTGTPFIRDFTLPVLEEYATFAKEKNSTLYTFLQTYGDKYDEASYLGKDVARNLKSVNDLRFQVAYNMAYGTQGFVCFTYESQAQFGASMIYATGGKTKNYYYVQEVFNELKEWEHVYKAFDWEGTMAVSGTATGNGVQSGHLASLEHALASHDRISSIETNYDLLVGTFKDSDNNDGFFVTSYTDPYYEIANTVKLTFNDASKAIVYKNGELQTNYDKTSCYVLENGVLEMTLEAGDYLFVIPME